jgi:hypothetical protein
MATVHHLHDPHEGYHYHFLRGQPWRDDLGHQIEVDELDHPDEYAHLDANADVSASEQMIGVGLVVALATFSGWLVLGPLAAAFIAIVGAQLAHFYLRRRPSR